MLLLACFLLPVNIAQAELTASVDRTTISKNDIIQLTIRSDKGPLEQADFSELEKSFSVVNKRRSNQISIINGDKQAIYDLTLVLFPKRDGTLTIPAFKSQGENSQAIQVEVSAGLIDSQQARDEVFFDNQVNRQEVYVQEQLLYTLRLFHAVGLSEAKITPLSVDNAVIEFVGDQKKYQTVLDGIRYSVVERRYAIFPEKSGQLTLPELVFTGRAISNHNSYNNRINNNNLLGSNSYIRTRSASHVIKVLPKPANYPASELWLPTPALHINDSWGEILPTLKVGEPVTRTLTLTAENLSAPQLPDLKLPATAQLKMYPDQPQSKDGATTSGVIGQRSFSTAIVPSVAGTVEIPALKVVWWNTATKKIEESIVPAKTLNVVPAAISISNQAVNTPPQSVPAQGVTGPQSSLTEANGGRSGIWPLVSLIFALLWLVTAFLWWRGRPAMRANVTKDLQPAANDLSAHSAYKTFKKACLKNDAKTTRQALLDWFRLSHSQHTIKNLKQITQLLQDDELTRLIRELESHLYGSDQTTTTWHGAALFDVIERLEKSSKQQIKTNRNSALKPLYPL